MPSKGVDYYSYIAIDGTTVRFSGPKVGGTNGTGDNFVKHHLEIESSNLPWYTFTGTFSWDVIRNGTTIYSRSQDISSLTGNLGDGNLKPLVSTPAVVGSDYIITYGLYDAGSGMFGLPNADQAWVTVTPNLSKWMGTLAPVSSPAADKPFSTYVLAAAHDAGMNSMVGINIVTRGTAAAVFYGVLGALIPPAAALLVAQGPDICLDLAITQKETTTTMLNMGVRYFDFRPAYLVPGVRDVVASSDNTLYHTHLVIPGQRFDSFLTEIVNFLKANPTEIAVVRTCSDGIKLCEVPSHDVISQFAKNAAAGSGIVIGDNSSFQKKISDLRTSNTRLILVMDDSKYDSYSDGAYATLTPTTIVNSFSGMSAGGQSGGDFTVLQCQGTATGITDVLAYAAAAANVSTSPLMATKAYFDIVTLPWIRSNALTKFTAQKNIMIMNDFIDGATAYLAYQLSQARFDGKTSVAAIPSKTAAAVTAAVAGAVSGIAAAANAAAVAAAAHAVDQAAHQIAAAAQSIQLSTTPQAAQQAKAAADKELQELQIKFAHLNAIVATSKALKSEGKPVDETALKVQQAAANEMAAVIAAQQQVVATTVKRIVEAQAGHL